MTRRPGSFRDRHGRGFRSVVFQAAVPAANSRKSAFAALSAELFETVRIRAAGELDAVQLHIDAVPSPQRHVGPELGRVYPAARKRPATLVLFYLPISRSVSSRFELRELIADVLAEQAALLCTKDADELRP